MTFHTQISNDYGNGNGKDITVIIIILLTMVILLTRLGQHPECSERNRGKLGEVSFQKSFKEHVLTILESVLSKSSAIPICLS